MVLSCDQGHRTWCQSTEQSLKCLLSDNCAGPGQQSGSERFETASTPLLTASQRAGQGPGFGKIQVDPVPKSLVNRDREEGTLHPLYPVPWTLNQGQRNVQSTTPALSRRGQRLCPCPRPPLCIFICHSSCSQEKGTCDPIIRSHGMLWSHYWIRLESWEA